jgi:hypothetical protein
MQAEMRRVKGGRASELERVNSINAAARQTLSKVAEVSVVGMLTRPAKEAAAWLLHSWLQHLFSASQRALVAGTSLMR